MTAERKRRKIRAGRVMSDLCDKTITVNVERTVRHPLYGRVVRKRKNYVAHDEQNQAHIGDLVEIAETRPLSKTKHWRLTRVIEQAK
ncbi:MAG: 30S ribosomal protein S17 [Candidatus Latescibacteria bacterium]|jgi:small subunit ribosomal protein S17|nr:30S ribosomal protein S17 [Candidatus Latescibacterota bacterium]